MLLHAEAELLERRGILLEHHDLHAATRRGGEVERKLRVRVAPDDENFVRALPRQIRRAGDFAHADAERLKKRLRRPFRIEQRDGLRLHRALRLCDVQREGIARAPVRLGAAELRDNRRRPRSGGERKRDLRRAARLDDDLAGLFLGTRFPRIRDGAVVAIVIDEEKRLLDLLAREIRVVHRRELAPWTGNPAEEVGVVLDDDLARLRGDHSADVEDSARVVALHRAEALDAGERVRTRLPVARTLWPLEVRRRHVPRKDHGDAARAHVADVAAQVRRHHLLHVLLVRGHAVPRAVVDVLVALAVILDEFSRAVLERILAERLLAENRGVVFVDEHPLAAAPRTPDVAAPVLAAIARPRRDVRCAPFDDEHRHDALLLPRLEPVAALLDRCPVEIAVERVEAAVPARLVVVHRTPRVDLGEEFVHFLRVLAEALAPVDYAGGNVRLETRHDLGVLVGFVSRLVVRGRPEDEPGDVLEHLDLVAHEILVGALELPVERLVRRRVLARMRKSHDREHADLRRGAERKLEVSVAALGEAVGSVDLGIEAVAAHTAERILRLFGGDGRRRIHAGILGAEVDRLPVQKKIPALHRHLAVAELLAVELVNRLAVLEKRHAHGVDVFWSVCIPDLRVLPFTAKDLALAGRGGERRGLERLHFLPAFEDVCDSRRAEGTLALKTYREFHLAVRDLRTDLDVVESETRRLRRDVDVAVEALVGERLLSHGARLVRRVEHLHELFGKLRRSE